uniref:Uncharacterized protein n=1 Tax=Mus musculus TaxID=10090 RepID=Q3TZ26_MOUSE|nr:unnamed protein product [Mus musculus]BAE34384.1 unnamed protein product [Mus musculus]
MFKSSPRYQLYPKWDIKHSKATLTSEYSYSQVHVLYVLENKPSTSCLHSLDGLLVFNSIKVPPRFLKGWLGFYKEGSRGLLGRKLAYHIQGPGTDLQYRKIAQQG